MYRTYANAFYKSQAWRTLRDSYFKETGGLCEACYEQGLIVPGEIVHHKIHLNETNINNPEVALNPKNLELLCRKCHAKEHPEVYKSSKRYRVDEYGKIILKE